MLVQYKRAFSAVGEDFIISNRDIYIKLYLLLRLNSAVMDSKRKYEGKQLQEAILFNVNRIESMLNYVNERNL